MPNWKYTNAAFVRTNSRALAWMAVELSAQFSSVRICPTDAFIVVAETERNVKKMVGGHIATEQ